MFLTTNPSFPMAGIVAVASAALFAIRYIRPEASREYDLVFSVMGLIYALCLFLEGWRLIPLMFFAQVLVIAFGGFFAFESFRLRLQLVEKSRQAAGGTAPRREGFNRTYRPAQAEYGSGRVVSRTASDSPRMRRVVDPDRTFESRETRRRPANRQPPRLAPGSSDSEGSAPRPQRPRPSAPQDPRDQYDQYQDPSSPDSRRDPRNRDLNERDNPPRREPPTDRRVRPSQPPTQEWGEEYGYDDYPETEPKARRPRPPVVDTEGEEDVLPPSSRRRPPQLPEEEQEERFGRRPSDRVIEVSPVDVEVEAVDEDDDGDYPDYKDYDD
ncbi:MAG: Ycf66 family protein [Cyanophyceae cyanobacterium]